MITKQSFRFPLTVASLALLTLTGCDARVSTTTSGSGSSTSVELGLPPRSSTPAAAPHSKPPAETNLAPLAGESATRPSEPAGDAAPASADGGEPAGKPAGDQKDGKEPKDGEGKSSNARSDRSKGLGQFGGGGGGGLGGGGGGLGGGGGGGLGGGGGGGGLGGGGQGGVSIDPKIKTKADTTGKLNDRKKEAATKKPAKGTFSAD